MPANKDLKRLVRARMTKTGEAYTAARAQITKRPKAKPVATDYAALAGMSDDRIKEKTGCNWERWVYALDRKRADEMSHREIVDLVHEKYKITGWWAQTVTVGYERIKGIRARGQRRDGSYEATKSRTFDVPVTTLFGAWADPKIRKQWLDQEIKVRTATEPKSMRIGWSDGNIVAVGFYPKGNAKSSVAVQHPKLPDKAAADRLKQYWSERLDLLDDLLV
ncbi:MAG: hypothetical protein ABR585_11120 [Gemmatimonadaceae bacterium]